MLALAGAPLQIACTTLDPAADSPASQVAPRDRRCLRRPRTSRRARRRRRPGDLRVRERARRRGPLRRDAAAGVPAARRPRSGAGPLVGEAVVRRGRPRGAAVRAGGFTRCPHRRARPHRHARGGEVAPSRLRRQGSGRDPRRRVGRRCVAIDRRGPRVARGVRAVRPGGLDRGCARSRRSVRRLSAGGEPPSRRDPAAHAGAGARRHRRDADGGRTTCAHGDGLARLRRRARDRAVLRRGAAARERDGAPRAQQRPLDRSSAPRPASSNSTCARSSGCRSARPNPSG